MEDAFVGFLLCSVTPFQRVLVGRRVSVKPTHSKLSFAVRLSSDAFCWKELAQQSQPPEQKGHCELCEAKMSRPDMGGAQAVTSLGFCMTDLAESQS